MENSFLQYKYEINSIRQIDGSVKDWSNSSALAMELLQSGTKSLTDVVNNKEHAMKKWLQYDKLPVSSQIPQWISWLVSSSALHHRWHQMMYLYMEMKTM